MEEHHLEEVTSVLKSTCSISCMAIAMEVRISLASDYSALNDDQRVMLVLFLPPPTCSIRDMKAMHSLIAF
jgi:hypothetical protein